MLGKVEEVFPVYSCKYADDFFKKPFYFFPQRCHLLVKTEDLGFSYLVSCSSHSDDMVWVQGSDALIDQGTAVGARGHDDVFASRGFCQLEAKGSHAQHSPDGPAQHSISSCLQKRYTAMLNHTDEQLKHKGERGN